jgi:hypothetical protein
MKRARQCAAQHGLALRFPHAAISAAASEGTCSRAGRRIPLATLKIVAAIHWQALRRWLKGARFRHTPAGHDRPIAAHFASSGTGETPEKPRLVA